MKKVIISLITALVALVVAITGFIVSKQTTKKVANTEGTEEIKEIKTVRLNEVTHSVFYAPLYAAISNGFYEEEGIELELTNGGGADNVMTAILSNQCDIGLCGPEASIYVYNEGREDYVEVFAQLTKRDGSFLVAKDPTDNFSWQDLKGKTVIPGRKGGVPYMTFEWILKQNGINPATDLVLDDSIKFDLMAGAFASGNAEYVTLFEPTASMTEEAGAGYIVASVGEASGDIPYTAYCAKKSFISENEDLIEGFTRATYKGQKWVKEHTAREVAEKIVDFFPDTEVDSIETSVQSYKNIDAWNENPILTEESFDKLQMIMQEAGELDSKAPYDVIINNDYAEKVVNEK